MEVKTKYLEASPGNQSNSRRIAWNAFWMGIVFSFLVLAAGLFDYITNKSITDRPSLMSISLAAGAIFGSISGSAMAFVFFQKTQEPKKLKDEGQVNET